ncbi:hypothetical protein [Streptomyces sp. H39-C1]|uniref:hypothetical protein n=1 Tax=Streptomyces sp. H39-C1 TaxID=3004355 RepID=UPI0022AEB6CD|nr:hypothetical protein [Streptomyces sp. H39-C1]MCZ4103701.1 hypothetical protein [Streptomyces sp. H39-C1]
MTEQPLPTTAQLHTCLRAIGVQLPVPDPMPRALALGLLRFCVESAATADTGRQEHAAGTGNPPSGSKEPTAAGLVAARREVNQLQTLAQEQRRALDAMHLALRALTRAPIPQALEPTSESAPHSPETPAGPPETATPAAPNSTPKTTERGTPAGTPPATPARRRWALRRRT